MKRLQLALLILLPTCIFAQGAEIRGTVLEDGLPLPFAHIQLEGSPTGTTSDEDGQYFFKDLSPGDYTVIYSYVGYVPVKKKITLEEKESAVLDITMTANAALQEVVVTGTMKPTYITASPIKVEVVSAKQMNTYMPAAASSVVDGIKLGVNDKLNPPPSFWTLVMPVGLSAEITVARMVHVGMLDYNADIWFYLI